MLFNNSVELFKNLRGVLANRKGKLIVMEGHVFTCEPDRGGDCVARFADDTEAQAVLYEAGYTKEVSEVNLIFKP